MPYEKRFVAFMAKDGLPSACTYPKAMERQGFETSFAPTFVEYRDGVIAAHEKIAIHQ
jgi:hypothetical protein